MGLIPVTGTLVLSFDTLYTLWRFYASWSKAGKQSEARLTRATFLVAFTRFASIYHLDWLDQSK
jgi:hypothetical protein